MMTKRITKIVWATLMTLIVALVAITPITEAVSNHDEAVFTEVLRLGIGDGDYEVGYDYGTHYLHLKGPGGFVIMDGELFILDSVNRRIQVFNLTGEYKRGIALPAEAWPTQICCYEGRIYVLDYDYDRVISVSASGGSTQDTADVNMEKYDLPESLPGELVCDLYAAETGVAVTDIENNHYYLKQTGSFELGKEYSAITSPERREGVPAQTAARVKYGEQTWSIDRENIINDIEPKGADSNGSLYTAFYEMVPNTSVFLMEKTLRRYDQSGKLTGCALIDFADDYTYPNQEFSIQPDGSVYYMACRDGYVSIQTIRLGTTYASQMDKLARRAAEIKMQHAEDEMSEKAGHVYNVSVSRSTARSRAMSAANYTWSLRAKNKEPHPSIKLPNYIQQASVGQTVKGIPYCRGGFNGCDTLMSTTYGKAFSLTINDYRSGDVSPKDFKGVATGLDCSGLVSSAYRFSSKYNTGGLQNDVGHVLGGLQDLRQMDFAVKSGDHVVLFDRKNNKDEYQIIDATTTTTSSQGVEIKIEKVSLRVVNGTYMNRFVYRTPWCQANSAYVSNTTHHWHKCKFSGCGSGIKFGYETHVWTPVTSTVFRCECGKIMRNDVVINEEENGMQDITSQDDTTFSNDGYPR